MTDEFLTQGLQEDRYLKAIQLIDQFENEIEATLLEFGQRMVNAQPDLFDPNPDPDTNTNRTSSSTLTHTRINYDLTGPQAPDSDQTLILNVHLYWVTPTEYGRTDVEGALHAFGYKIKYASEDTDDRVVQQTLTGDWPIETSSNPFDSNTAFYRHVDSTEDIENTAEVLVEHFAEFGNAYATSPAE
ncbi:hypothetical protein ACLI4Z_19180 [Natrialbaceae archaeon A-arb3/5]